MNNNFKNIYQIKILFKEQINIELPNWISENLIYDIEFKSCKITAFGFTWESTYLNNYILLLFMENNNEIYRITLNYNIDQKKIIGDLCKLIDYEEYNNFDYICQLNIITFYLRNDEVDLNNLYNKKFIKCVNSKINNLNNDEFNNKILYKNYLNKLDELENIKKSELFLENYEDKIKLYNLIIKQLIKIKEQIQNKNGNFHLFLE